MFSWQFPCTTMFHLFIMNSIKTLNWWVIASIVNKNVFLQCKPCIRDIYKITHPNCNLEECFHISFTWTNSVNSLVPERCGSKFTNALFKLNSQLDILSTFCEIGIRWVPQNPFNISTLVQLIHLSLNKMAAILQPTFLHAFLRTKSLVFWFEFVPKRLIDK